VNKKTTDFYEELKKKEQKFKYSLKALSIADISHRGQKRKFINEDYINHPVRVAWKIFLQPMYASPTAEMFDRLDENIAIALCHDVFEDTKTKIEDVKEFFTSYIIEGFEALTRREHENYYDFIMRIKQTPYREIKIFDLEDNMFDLKESSLKDKYRLACYALAARADMI